MILAVDPSIANCGWAVARVVAVPGVGAAPCVIASGVWHPSKAKGSAPPCEQLADYVARLIGSAGVRDVAVEIPDGGERCYRDKAGVRHQIGGGSERAYAMAVGACRAAARVAGARVWPVKVSTWKGNRRKAFDVAIARGVLGREPRDTNEADAVGLALWWLSFTSSRGMSPARVGEWTELRYRELVEAE